MNAPLKPIDRMEGTPPEPANFHELANLFPMMDGKAYRELVEDVRANGVQEPIVFLDGKILDGRNRYGAAREVGIEYPRVEFTGNDPLAFVISANLKRRHLSESQRAMIAKKISTMPRGGAQYRTANLQTDKPQVSQAEAAKTMNVSERSVAAASKVVEFGAPGLAEAVEKGDVKVSSAADIASLPVEEQAEVIRRADPKAFAKVAKEARAARQDEKKAKRAEREQELGAKQAALPDRRYGVIIADPEWDFEPYSRETGMDRSAANHYPTSDLEQIKGRQVSDIAAADCILFLWCTPPFLRHGMEVLEAWGFAYVTEIVWDKVRTGNARGPGYWFTGEHESVLIGKRGSPPAPAPGSQFPSRFQAPVGRHSEKPANVHEIAEAYFPNLPKIELNARQARDGWSTWGNEAPDSGEDA